MARAARDFFKDFDVLAPENPKFSLYIDWPFLGRGEYLSSDLKFFGAGILMRGYLNART